MSVRNIILFVILGLSINAQAVTLKELAIKSSVILAASENPDILKKCKKNLDQISILSFDLKEQTEVKIHTLTESDLKILDQRAATCEQDCTCAIYAMAFEFKNKPHTLLSEKAAKLTAVDRKKCVSKLKDICGKYLR